MSNYQVHLLAPLAHNNESHPFGPNDRPCMTINKRFKGIGPSPNLTHSAVICAQVLGLEAKFLLSSRYHARHLQQIIDSKFSVGCMVWL